MSRVLRFTEAEFQSRIQARMSRTAPDDVKTKSAPGTSGKDAASGAASIGSGIDADSHQQKGGLVMLPYPISANRYFRNFRGRMVISSEAKAYKKQVIWTFDALGITPSSGDVSLTVKLHPKLTTKGVASRTLIDLDNALKVVFDALQGVLYVNDKQVKKLTAEVGEPVLGGGLSVGIV